MAKTEEKRQRIKWYHARRVFFVEQERARGLSLARDCTHEDARLLVSLFAGGLAGTLPETAVFLSHSEQDARCLCWAAETGASDQRELIRRSAKAGYAWAQALYGDERRGWTCSQEGDCVEWLEKAVKQGEPVAMARLASLRLPAVEEGKKSWIDLCQEAAYLGDCDAQLKYARCGLLDPEEQFVWLRRSASCGNGWAVGDIGDCVVAQLKLFDEGKTTGRIVFESGFAFVAHGFKWRHRINESAVVACKRAIKLYNQWRREARIGVMCWLWLAKQMGVSRDIRVLIAGLIWDEKAAWSERKRSATEKPLYLL